MLDGLFSRHNECLLPDCVIFMAVLASLVYVDGNEESRKETKVIHKTPPRNSTTIYTENEQLL
jgi:hypothetical protein